MLGLPCATWPAELLGCVACAWSHRARGSNARGTPSESNLRIIAQREHGVQREAAAEGRARVFRMLYGGSSEFESPHTLHKSKSCWNASQASREFACRHTLRLTVQGLLLRFSDFMLRIKDLGLGCRVRGRGR